MSRRDSHALERLVFFSDAVFAIAITLLVIELHAPERLQPYTSENLWRALAGQAPALLGFVISFGVVSLFWANHHRSMGLLARADQRLLWRNFGLLFAIALLPFPTAIISRYFPLAAGQQIYLSLLLLAAVAQWRLLLLAFREGLYLSPEADGREVALLRRRAAALALTVLFALLLTFWQPIAGVSALILLPFSLTAAGSRRWER